MAFQFAGLKKQLNKANQYMSERISGIEGTKLNNEFQDMERRTDVFNDLVEDLQIKTKEYLQPNPTVRAKMAAVKGISKLSGQAKASTYPQPEGTLGDAMTNYGRKLQDYEDAGVFASALMEMGESLKQMADLKYALDDNVKQNFLEPLHHTQSKDLKEVMHHRKKLTGRKLDFDCKKRKGAPEEELQLAQEKFAESLQLAQVGMHNLLDGSGAEHITQLSQLAETLLEYHKNCAEILQSTTVRLFQKAQEAAARPRSEFKPKTLEDLGIERVNRDYGGGGGGFSSSASSYSFASAPPPVPSSGGLTSSSSFPSAAPVQRGGSFSSLYNYNQTPALISTSPTSSTTTTISGGGFHRGQPSPSSFADAWGETTSSHPMPLPRPTTTSQQATCRALYDFDAENSSELSFKEGDLIALKAKIDENWYEGSLNGRSGFFPVSYVTVVVPLSK